MKALEERTKPAEAEKLDLFATAKRATSRISSQIDELAGARAEAALSPVVFWRWLTSDGSDPGAPVRVLVTAFAVLAVCWAAQAAAAAWLRRAFARRARSGLPPSAGSVELTLFVRWVAFLGVLLTLQALVPGGGNRLTRPGSPCCLRLPALGSPLAPAQSWCPPCMGPITRRR